MLEKTMQNKRHCNIQISFIIALRDYLKLQLTAIKLLIEHAASERGWNFKLDYLPIDILKL